jgi:hypothetical protein
MDGAAATLGEEARRVMAATCCALAAALSWVAGAWGDPSYGLGALPEPPP